MTTGSAGGGSIASFTPNPPRAELFLDFGLDGKTSTRVEITGEAAIRLVKIMAELESNAGKR
jgi:hypothetical protein